MGKEAFARSFGRWPRVDVHDGAQCSAGPSCDQSAGWMMQSNVAYPCLTKDLGNVEFDHRQPLRGSEVSGPKFRGCGIAIACPVAIGLEAASRQIHDPVFGDPLFRVKLELRRAVVADRCV